MGEPCGWEEMLQQSLGVDVLLAIKCAAKFLWLFRSTKPKIAKPVMNGTMSPLRDLNPENPGAEFASAQCLYRAAPLLIVGTGLTLPVHPCLLACTIHCPYLFRLKWDFCV